MPRWLRESPTSSILRDKVGRGYYEYLGLNTNNPGVRWVSMPSNRIVNRYANGPSKQPHFVVGVHNEENHERRHVRFKMVVPKEFNALTRFQHQL